MQTRLEKQKLILLAAVFLTGAVLLTGIAGCGTQNKTGEKESETVEENVPESKEKIVEEDKRIAVIETNKGTIKFKFFSQDAPNTVENFVKLAKQDFYNGTKFHRVEPGFVIQGGNPNSKDDDPSNDGKGGPGYTIKAEFNENKHVDGTVAMARTQDPDSAGSQFYIALGPQPHLDGKYTVFGQVTEGLEVVHKIQKDDVMTKVYIGEK